jgi:hypothetical protein
MPLAPRKFLQTGDLDIKILISKNLTRQSGSADDYCEAILKVWILGAQGQMSHDLAGGLWISVRLQFGGAKLHKSFSANSAPLDDKGLEAGPHLIGTGQRERSPVFRTNGNWGTSRLSPVSQFSTRPNHTASVAEDRLFRRDPRTGHESLSERSCPFPVFSSRYQLSRCALARPEVRCRPSLYVLF